MATIRIKPIIELSEWNLLVAGGGDPTDPPCMLVMVQRITKIMDYGSYRMIYLDNGESIRTNTELIILQERIEVADKCP